MNVTWFLICGCREVGDDISNPKLSLCLQLMSQLFVPMLAREGARGEDAIFWFTEEQHMMEHIGNELLTNMQRFSSQVKLLTLAFRETIAE